MPLCTNNRMVYFFTNELTYLSFEQFLKPVKESCHLIVTIKITIVIGDPV